jgi:beta-alanine degradation protein BauB
LLQAALSLRFLAPQSLAGKDECRSDAEETRMNTFLTRSVVGVVALLGAFAVGRSQQPSVTSERYPQFENEDVRVWKSVVVAGAPLALHRHDHPRVIIALTGGTMQIVQQGAPSETHVWEAGKAYWLPANAPNTMHTDANVGGKPIEVMVVELKHEQ